MLLAFKLDGNRKVPGQIISFMGQAFFGSASATAPRGRHTWPRVIETKQAGNRCGATDRRARHGVGNMQQAASAPNTGPLK
jgi:hypothetical protein